MSWSVDELADKNKMMFVRPRNCRSCGHGFFALGHVVNYAQQKGLWDIIDIAEEQAVKSEVYAAIDQNDPGSFYGFGHGNDCIYTGDTEQDIFTCDECDRVNGRIIYLLSCLTANGLGPAMMKQGAEAYAGFNVSWTWISDSGTDGDPYDDMYALGFYQSANELWIALIDGYNIVEAIQASIDMYTHWIDYWFENPDAQWSQDAIQWLIYDRDALVGLTFCDAIKLQDECETAGCQWYGGSCHSVVERAGYVESNWYLAIPIIALVGIAILATKK